MPTIDTNTVGTAADYADLELWEVGEVADLPAADRIARAAMLNEVHTSTFAFSDVGWVTDATRYPWIDAADGAQHDGTRGSGARIIPSAGGVSLNINLNFNEFHITRIEVSTTSAASGQTAIRCGISGGRVSLDNVLIYDLATSTTNLGIQVSGTCNLTLVNGMIFDIPGVGIQMLNGVQTNVIYNTTIWNNGVGSFGLDIREAVDGEKDIDLRNCLIQGVSAAIIATFATGNLWNAACDQNILNDASGTAEVLPGTLIESATFQAGTGGAGTRVMFVSLTGGSEDLHLALPAVRADNSALDFGNNLTPPTVTLPSNIFVEVDIDGETRPSTGAWDAGCDHLFPEEVVTVGLWSTRQVFGAGDCLLITADGAGKDNPEIRVNIDLTPS